MKKRQATFSIATELFLQVMHLPENTKVVDVWMDDELRDIKICVEHPDLKEVGIRVSAAADPQYAAGIDGKAVFVGWGQK